MYGLIRWNMHMKRANKDVGLDEVTGKINYCA